MMYNCSTQIPIDLLLQRLLDYKLKKSKRMLSKKDISNRNIESLPQQIYQEKKKIQTCRTKQDMSKFFFFNRKPFLSTFDIQSPKAAMHSLSPQNRTNVNPKINQFDVERKTLQMSQHMNEKQNAQAMNFQLLNILSKIENSDDQLQRLQMISKGFANLLMQLFDQFQKNCQKDLSKIWDQNQKCLIMIMSKPEEQKDESKENLAQQNKQLKQIISSHTTLLSQLRTQFDNLQRQVEEQKPLILKKEREQQNGTYEAPNERLSNGQWNQQNTQSVQNGLNVTQSMVKQLKIGTNLEDIRVEQNFQEEFMSKFNEFSLSWRNAAMQLKH